jgi:hypothetical protein
MPNIEWDPTNYTGYYSRPASHGQPTTFFGEEKPRPFARKRTTPVVGLPGAQRRHDEQQQANAAKRTIGSSTTNKMLIINCYTTDHAPGSAKWNALTGSSTASAERTRQMAVRSILFIVYIAIRLILNVS